MKLIDVFDALQEPELIAEANGTLRVARDPENADALVILSQGAGRGEPYIAGTFMPDSDGGAELLLSLESSDTNAQAALLIRLAALLLDRDR